MNFIVKLPIVNYLSNKRHSLSKAKYLLTDSTGSEIAKDSSKECQYKSSEEKQIIGSIISEEHERLSICVYSKECDSKSENGSSNMTTYSTISMLSTLLFLLFFIKGNIFCFSLFIVLIFTLLGLDYYTQTIITSWFANCDILDKPAFCNVNSFNDVAVSIKVQNFRSRYSKYTYYNCARVVCKCHGNKRDREPSRKPINKLRRLSHKTRNLQRYISSRVLKTIPKSSQVHRIISSISIRTELKGKKKFTHRRYLTFVHKMRKKPGPFARKYGHKTMYLNKKRKEYQKLLNLLSCNLLHNEFLYQVNNFKILVISQSRKEEYFILIILNI